MIAIWAQGMATMLAAQGSGAPGLANAQPVEIGGEVRITCAQRGPVRRFGETDARVIGCEDGGLILDVADDQPAGPFTYWISRSSDGGYRVGGHGSSTDRDALVRTTDYLKTLTADQWRALYRLAAGAK